MELKKCDIRDYFKDHIDLENSIRNCDNTGDVVKAIITSNYFKNLNRDILMFNENNLSNGDKSYELNVNFKVDLCLRGEPNKEIPFKHSHSHNYVEMIYVYEGAYSQNINGEKVSLKQGECCMLNQNNKEIPFKHSHSHNYVEMIYVYEGAYSQNINGEKVSLKQGECCMLNQNIKHRDEPIYSGDTVLFLSFSNKIFNKYLKEYINENKIIYEFINEKNEDERLVNQYILFKDGNNEAFNKILRHIVYEYFNKDIGTNYIIMGYIARLFNLLSTDYNEHVVIKDNAKKENIIFEQIEKYVDENISEVSREKIAENLHYNANYINTIIKINRGITYSEYIANKRLEASIELLKDSNISINNIIREVGYINKSYFYKLFLAKFGVTPKEFRMMLRNSFCEES